MRCLSTPIFLFDDLNLPAHPHTSSNIRLCNSLTNGSLSIISTENFFSSDHGFSHVDLFEFVELTSRGNRFIEKAIFLLFINRRLTFNILEF